MFDADAFDVELGAPRLKIGGRTYVGRILSFEEFAPFEKRSMALDDPAPRQEHPERWKAEFHALAADYLRTVFPAPPWWQFWRQDPVPQMLAHHGLLQGLKDFFEIQARALKLMMGASQKAAGSDSAPRIAAA